MKDIELVTLAGGSAATASKGTGITTPKVARSKAHAGHTLMTTSHASLIAKDDPAAVATPSMDKMNEF
jgi:hypothetical protein